MEARQCGKAGDPDIEIPGHNNKSATQDQEAADNNGNQTKTCAITSHPPSAVITRLHTSQAEL